MKPPKTVIFTDLDNTLLDDRGELGKAAPFIRKLSSRGIPVIPATSKTAMEVMILWRRWRLHGPAVVENGAAICLPHAGRGWRIRRLTTWRYSQIRALICQLRTLMGLPLQGFGDWPLKTLCRMTGLSPINAMAARARIASEPLHCTVDAEVSLLEYLHDTGLNLIQGGRFLTLQPATVDKARGAAILLNHLRAGGRWPRVIALGDAPNDIRLLEMADLAACLPGPHTLPVGLHCFRAPHAGPSGWIDALTHLGVC